MRRVFRRIHASAAQCQVLQRALSPGGVSPASGGCMSADILQFRTAARIANCRKCGSHYRPQPDDGGLCHPCFWWARALRAMAAADSAFHQLRAGGYR